MLCMSTLVLNLYVLYYNETENINEIDLINMNLSFFFFLTLCQSGTKQLHLKC